MSLIITSSSADTFDDVSKGEGLNKPFNYQNNFRSPLVIEPNSEIAVASVKCNRTGISLSEDRTYAVYWGTPPGTFTGDDQRSEIPQVTDIPTIDGEIDSEANDPEDPQGENLTAQQAMGCSPNRPLYITLPAGEYSKESFDAMLQARTERVLMETYEHIKSVKVELQVTANDGDVNDDLTAGVWKGYVWTFLQDDANSSGTQDPQMDFTPYIDSETLKVDSTDFGQFSGTNTQDYGVEFYTNKFTTTTSVNFTKVKKEDAGLGSLQGTRCEAIGTGKPLGLSTGFCTFDIQNCSGGFCVGLVRNNVTNYQNQSGKQYRKFDVPPGFNDDLGDINTRKDGGGTPTYYDYGVQWVEGQDLEIFHTNSQESFGSEGRKGLYTKPSTLVPLNTVTNASLSAGYYDEIEFLVNGEQVSINIRQKGKADVNLALFNSVVGTKPKPIGMSNNLLFPKIYIEEDNDEIALVNWYHSENSHSKAGTSEGRGQVHDYFTVRYLGQSLYTPLGVNDQVKFNSRGEQKARLLAHEIDTSRMFQVKAGITTSHTSVGQNASNGIDYFFSLHTSPSDHWGIPWGTSAQQRLVGSSKVLGLQAGNYRSVNGKFPSNVTGNTTTLWSQVAPKPDSMGNLFVRVSSLPHNSFNGCKESMSKILWTLPRFDARGEEDGALFFEPQERIYIDLENNAGNQVINNLQVQIVDINEKEAQDLVGNTIVILHIRKKGKVEKEVVVRDYLRN